MPKKSRFARNSKLLPLSPVRRSLSCSPVFRDAGLCKTHKIIQNAKKIVEERILLEQIALAGAKNSKSYVQVVVLKFNF